MITVGEISYTNIMPLYYYLNKEAWKKEGVRFISGVPSFINSLMKEGAVDVGGISSFSFGENSSDYCLFPDLSVSSFGAVGSIFLFSKVPASRLGGKTIALTSSSASSAALLKVILSKFYRQEANYSVVHPDLQAMLASHDACLLIGDDALAAKRVSSGLFVYDLGEQWKTFTGCPMTFAVMAVRRSAAEKSGRLLEKIKTQMQESRDRCVREQFRPLVRTLHPSLGGDEKSWHSYFSGLDYYFNGEHEKGLQLYYQYAYECGLLSKQPVITYFDGCMSVGR
ncbi:menaquinone biosynthetic enzyme MqnA/MqnD family protein [Fictibacillus iocasae]|uniref:Chorismate dehydratase n=1 Tax=Fictibacillus iocasae TaxID=2715437 RepID=A0ABW2NL30_9BACL